MVSAFRAAEGVHGDPSVRAAIGGGWMQTGMGRWNDGMVERWNDGLLRETEPSQPNIPTFQYSNIP
jgi:hypothetical protein